MQLLVHKNKTQLHSLKWRRKSFEKMNFAVSNHYRTSDRLKLIELLVAKSNTGNIFSNKQNYHHLTLLRSERSVFLKNFENKIFWYSYYFWKHISREYLFVSKFLLEVFKFKENVLICIITVIKVHGLLLTLFQAKTVLAT